MADPQYSVKKITDLTTNPSTNDSDLYVLGNQGTATMRKITFSTIASAILNKLTSFTFNSLTTSSKNLPGAVNELNTKFTNNTSRTLIGDISPTAQTAYTLSESVRNFYYIEVIFRNGSYGNFVNRIMSTDSLGIGHAETLSFTAYNSSSYNFYAECGFIADTSFRISTFRSTGWTINKVYVVGISRVGS